jgi:thiosulfate reductase cytochrome b subunit
LVDGQQDFSRSRFARILGNILLQNSGRGKTFRWVAGVCYSPHVLGAGSTKNSDSPRHGAVVRVTHWLTVVAFFALLITGVEILISHPRFYWGEVGNSTMQPMFSLHIPASRDTVPTGYNYTMPDQNGWSRALHFQAAWLLLLTGLIYGIAGFWSGHFRKDLVPAHAQRSWGSIRAVMAKTFRRGPPNAAEARSYNVVQRATYLIVIFVLFPLVIWTGLAMSPTFTGAFPWTVIALGGRQSARTLHFFLSIALLLFVVVHVAMVYLAGFKSRMRAMIMGGSDAEEERL